MTHTSLYRKYRPSTFDDVVGQQHIERTLRNAVSEGKVAHAYLFTGPRGTGKTTTARLLAKALLCERGPTAEPDATCEDCRLIAEGNHPDVLELDAASRTGVDAVREEIIGRVAFAGIRGRHKVYIIDEAHMLSTAAFNALLKTLEEPPPNVVFVLCTTHPNKVPETIHSRCQRFDFRRLSVEDIADQLRFIAESEGIRAEKGVFTLIARHAEGGMRDAITALEQLAAYTGEEITADDVEGILGEVDSAQLFEAAALIARRDVVGAFRWVAEIVETGTDLFEFVRELTAHVRDLFVLSVAPDATIAVDRGAEDLAKLRAQAAEFGGQDRIAHVLDMLGELAAEMRWSSDPRLSLEVALTRMARPQGDLTLGSLAERVESIELALLGGASVGGSAPAREAAPAAPPAAKPASARASATAAQTEPAGATSPAAVQTAEAAAGAAPDARPQPAATPTPAPSAAPAAPAAPAARPAGPSLRAGALDSAAVKRNWHAVISEIKQRRPSRAMTFNAVEVDVDSDGQTLVIEFPADQSFSKQLAEDPETRELVVEALASVFGSAPPFRYQLGRGGVRPAEPARSRAQVPAPAPAEPAPTPSPTPASPAPAAAPVPTTRPAAAPPRRTDVAPEAPVPTDDEPMPEYYEIASGMSEPTASLSNTASTPRSDDFAQSLIDGLGATIVGEHAAPQGEDA